MDSPEMESIIKECNFIIIVYVHYFPWLIYALLIPEHSINDVLSLKKEIVSHPP